MGRSHSPEKDLKHAIHAVLSDGRFEGIPPDRRASLAVEFVWQWAAVQRTEEPNKGRPWSDESLRVILQEAPTHSNIVKLARAFGRGVGAIEQIYRWAATPDKVVKRKRPDDAFIAQIKRIAKEIGWEAF